jgi:hypothetical protein
MDVGAGLSSSSAGSPIAIIYFIYLPELAAAMIRSAAFFTSFLTDPVRIADLVLIGIRFIFRTGFLRLL